MSRDITLLVLCLAAGLVACGDSDSSDAGEETANESELSMGPDDALAQAACALLQGTQEPLIAVDNPSDAGQVLATPSESQAYLVTLPESGTGYITLEIPEWAIVIGASADISQTVTIQDPNSVTEERLSRSLNGSCPEQLTDQRTHFHEWGSFTVEITGEPGDDVLLSFIKEQ